MMKKSIICLLGPTASGKTPLAIELVQRFPCEIISVDSAMVYRGMDIGTAKPSKEILRMAPHRLIDLLDPVEAYSAGQFRRDALREIEAIFALNKIPLLVGGTMMYFRALQQGLADLPMADATLRAELTARAEREGWPALHAALAKIDVEAAHRINPNDSQRIQRALEVYQLSGQTITTLQAEATNPLSQYHIHNLAIAPAERSRLHERIALRLDQMLASGFVDEVRQLYARGDLSVNMPSIRSVGYRQVWEYVAGNTTEIEMREQILAATRQLAKRQMTWLRSWSDVTWIDSDAQDGVEQALASFSQSLSPQSSERGAN
jgi:tRNA dimethylallyltransferase